MKLQKIGDISEYKRIEEKYKRKDCISNNYMLFAEVANLVDEKRLFAIYGENNVFIAAKKDKCYRLYYYINDLSEILFLDNSGMPYSIEILFRGETSFPIREKSYLESCGFEQHIVREYFEAHSNDIQCLRPDSDEKLIISLAASKEEINYAFDLFNKTFDPYTGDYLSEEEILTFLKDNKLIIATYDARMVGALHYEIKNNTIWIAHLAVEERARGKHVAYNLVQRYIDMFLPKGRVRLALWVQQQNEVAKLLYQKFGFRYMNKSTVSFLKK